MNIRKNGKPFEVDSVFEVVENLKKYLPTKTISFINSLNIFYQESSDLIKKYNPKCFFIINHKQQSFDLDFGLIDSNNEFVIFYDKYNLNFNDGESFGIENYEFEVEEYLVEDLFWSFRDEILERIFYMWVLECVWNSNMNNLKIPFVYANDDFDEIFDLKNALKEYTNLEFLNK